ncbi:uncharacterized protein PHALS_06263 [Plasmopara halstedii]|uniref:Uncharacterized protein n=1 Tax=Plasmopara halstedii TaxID=4781 RepID=A0A0N7L7Z4_PLAHL|nr:uncharacterized protein PHALS_06263 [Plasmopara halstedii]CEG48443.1 hypothetical protein PHALS_06263 [Plasmopara halstedii]|eukprot:XP_024584812.1 hypothetical protein PHALS_06263 [Plasmopara halstedii]
MPTLRQDQLTDASPVLEAKRCAILDKLQVRGGIEYLVMMRLSTTKVKWKWNPTNASSISIQ